MFLLTVSNLVFCVILDILIIADDNIKNVHITNAEWVYLPEGQGLVDVRRRLMNEEWQREGVKIVILMTGQAEAAAGHQAMSNSVKNVLLSIRHAYPESIVLMCAPLPRARDGPLVLRDLDVLADVMHEVCLSEEYCEFSSIGSYFYGKYRLVESRHGGGPSSVLLVKSGLMDPQGLTIQGSRLIQKRLTEKIKTANLFERYVMLSSKLIHF